MSTTTSTGPSAGPLIPGMAGIVAVGRHWGLLLAYGAITAILGVMVLAWPGATLLVVAALFAIYLLVSGVFDVVQAIAEDERSAGTRVLLGVLGALSILVGLLCLRSPLQTLAVIALLIGAWWLISGVIEIVTAITSPGHHIWRLIGGAVSIVGGVIVILNPGMSLAVLTWFMGIWLVVYGIFAVGGAFALRSAAKKAMAAA